MTIVPAGRTLTFDYTAYDLNSTLVAAMKIYDVTTQPANQVATVPMSHIYGGSYVGNYSFGSSQINRIYLIHKGIYSDSTYTTLSNNLSPGAETVQVGGFDDNQGRSV